jgi:hypothetical protein
VLWELGALAVLYALLELLVLDSEAYILLAGAVRSGGAVLVALGPLAVGTMLIALGRVRMMRVPPHTPGRAILTVAAGLSWLRFALLVVAILLIGVGLLDTDVRPGVFRIGRLAWFLAICAALVAELSAVPALAVIGGEIPSRALRSRAATFTFAVQLLAALWIALVVSLASVGAMMELDPFPASLQRPGGGSGLGRFGRVAVLTVLLAVLLALQAGYNYLQYLLYSTAQGAGQSGGDRDS